MSARTKYAPRMMAARSGSRIGSGTGSRARIPAAAFAALLLAGCSSGHVGDDWQCPLASGGSCASVAAADPAVPKTDAAPESALGQPIRLLPREWGADDADRTAAPGTATLSCEANCGFDPFGWLARLLGAETEDGERPARDARPLMDGAGGEMAPKPSADKQESDAGTPAASRTSGTNTDDLRTGEVVARIWIAPFVDSEGIYREASHVRVVLEPAGWRLN